MKRDVTSWVYFVQRGTHGAIKIGSSDEPRGRLAALQSANDEELRLLLTVEGGEPLERVLHILCELDQKRGEWFHPNPLVLGVIQLLREQKLARAKARVKPGELTPLPKPFDLPPDDAPRVPFDLPPDDPPAARVLPLRRVPFDLPPDDEPRVPFDLPPDEPIAGKK
jgi:hypothetical protein